MHLYIIMYLYICITLNHLPIYRRISSTYIMYLINSVLLSVHRISSVYHRIYHRYHHYRYISSSYHRIHHHRIYHRYHYRYIIVSIGISSVYHHHIYRYIISSVSLSVYIIVSIGISSVYHRISSYIIGISISVYHVSYIILRGYIINF